MRTRLSNGDGTWISQGQQFTDGGGVLGRQVLVADVNGDHKDDIVFAFPNTWRGGGALEIRTRLSNGSGTWTSQAQTFPDGEGVFGGSVLPLDLNGDHKVDLAFAFPRTWCP